MVDDSLSNLQAALLTAAECHGSSLAKWIPRLMMRAGLVHQLEPMAEEALELVAFLARIQDEEDGLEDVGFDEVPI